MLATKMQIGFGVSVVIGELSRQLLERGYEVIIGVLEFDRYFADRLEIHRLPPDPEGLLDFIRDRHVDLVIAHTSPYFEALPKIADAVETVAWEHGDPTPDLFVHDREARAAIVANKQRSVYPQVGHVIAISAFIKREINWPQAEIIYNGADHLPVTAPTRNLDRPLQVGTLMRLGKGERFYKGGESLIDLARLLQEEQNQYTVSVMGRGTDDDAAFFLEHGISVHLNATDDERSIYLSGLDLFFSPSAWEGFNLPLVEAQMSGALAVALDVGAHPEVTPFVFSSIQDLAEYIRALNADRDRLYRLSCETQRRCIDRFAWSVAADQFIAYMGRAVDRSSAA